MLNNYECDNKANFATKYCIYAQFNDRKKGSFNSAT